MRRLEAKLDDSMVQQKTRLNIDKLLNIATEVLTRVINYILIQT